MTFEEYKKNIIEKSGLKAIIKKKIYKTMLVGFDILYEKIVVENNYYQKSVNMLNEQISKIKDDNMLLKKENYDLKERLLTFKDEIKYLKNKINIIEKQGNNDFGAVRCDIRQSVKQEKIDNASNEYEEIDYFDFENRFRGPIEIIRERQSMYLPYFQDRSNILDIGCGRGEMLSLLKDNGIIAKGIDLFKDYVEFCRNEGLNVMVGDGIEYIENSTEKYGGIFAGQVVEHISVGQILRFCKASYEHLEDGACLIIETPNPMCLSVFTNSFYIDPSHIKPVHPLTLKYYLEKAGFNQIEILYTDVSRCPNSIPKLNINGVDESELKEYNNAMHIVSELLFGSQDYAIIATK